MGKNGCSRAEESNELLAETIRGNGCNVIRMWMAVRLQDAARSAHDGGTVAQRRKKKGVRVRRPLACDFSNPAQEM